MTSRSAWLSFQISAVAAGIWFALWLGRVVTG